VVEDSRLSLLKLMRKLKTLCRLLSLLNNNNNYRRG